MSGELRPKDESVRKERKYGDLEAKPLTLSDVILIGFIDQACVGGGCVWGVIQLQAVTLKRTQRLKSPGGEEVPRLRGLKEEEGVVVEVEEAESPWLVGLVVPQEGQPGFGPKRKQVLGGAGIHPWKESCST